MAFKSVTIKVADDADYIKAIRKADREREIEMHGKQISTRPTRTHKSKKAYNRKKSGKKIVLGTEFE